MPLVTLLCDHDYYPPDNLTDTPTDRQELVIAAAADLPHHMIEHEDRLHLDEGTPLDGVLVDIRRFHAHAVNAPQIGLQVVFTEQLEETERLEGRDALVAMMLFWANSAIRKLGQGFSWSVDAFYAGGPGHGAFSNATGLLVIHDW